MTWAQLVGAVVELMSLCLFLKYELTNYEINLTLTLICCVYHLINARGSSWNYRQKDSDALIFSSTGTFK